MLIGSDHFQYGQIFKLWGEGKGGTFSVRHCGIIFGELQEPAEAQTCPQYLLQQPDAGRGLIEVDGLYHLRR